MPLLRLHQSRAIDLDFTLQSLATRSAFESAEVLVLCHTIDPAYGPILDWARELGTPLIYDSGRQPAGDSQRHSRSRLPARTRSAGANPDLPPAGRRRSDVFARPETRPHALQRERRHGQRPARLDFDSRIAAATRLQPGPTRLCDESGAGPIGRVLVRPLLRILDAWPTVDVTIWGPRFEELSGHPRVRHLPVVRSYDRFEVCAGALRHRTGAVARRTLLPLQEQ